MAFEKCEKLKEMNGRDTATILNSRAEHPHTPSRQSLFQPEKKNNKPETGQPSNDKLSPSSSLRLVGQKYQKVCKVYKIKT